MCTEKKKKKEFQKDIYQPCTLVFPWRVALGGREGWKSYLYFPPVYNVLLKMMKLVSLS